MHVPPPKKITFFFTHSLVDKHLKPPTPTTRTSEKMTVFDHNFHINHKNHTPTIQLPKNDLQQKNDRNPNIDKS